MTPPETTTARGWGLGRLLPTLALPVVAILASAMACERVVVWLIVGGAVYAWGMATLLGIQFRLSDAFRRPWQVSLRRMLLNIAVLCCVLSVLTTDWPLRARFQLSRRAIDALADRVQQGRSMTTPEYAGLFWIRVAEANRAGQPCLWIRLQPGGNTGLVRCRANGQPELNLSSSLELGDGWFLVSED
ncbi:MAG: hypothetical protein SGJ19_01075 [Planctomycetia bacterium]|nr:hypothetical protein [Planctomycetia bacterium]